MMTRVITANRVVRLAVVLLGVMALLLGGCARRPPQTASTSDTGTSSSDMIGTPELPWGDLEQDGLVDDITQGTTTSAASGDVTTSSAISVSGMSSSTVVSGLSTTTCSTTLQKATTSQDSSASTTVKLTTTTTVEPGWLPGIW